MNKFDENDLLKDFNMDSSRWEFDVPVFEVENKNVFVTLIISNYPDRNILWLSNFYNKSNKKGKARCTLYFMLKRMILHNDNVNEDTLIYIPDIFPSTKKNADMYERMGFSITQLQHNNLYVNVKPYQTVGNLIETLEEWCNNDKAQTDNELRAKRQRTGGKSKKIKRRRSTKKRR
jgi:hypothetical protein